MKASELISILQDKIKSDGDLQVGFYDNEYSKYLAAGNVDTQTADKEGVFADDEILGDKFFAINE
jgi:hypothetical protein